MKKKQKNIEKDEIKVEKEQNSADKVVKKVNKNLQKKEKKEKIIKSLEKEIDPDFTMALSKLINENMESAKEEIIKKTLKKANQMFEKIKKSNENSLLSTSNIVHSNVICDGCGVQPIFGNRYKCTICDDFDYCEACEDLNSESHKHPFLKIRKPDFAPIKIKCSIKEIVQEEIKPEVVKISGEDINVLPERFSDQDKSQEKEEGLLGKLKNTLTKTIPDTVSKVEGAFIAKVNSIVDKYDESNKYRNLVPIVRQYYHLENISDDELLKVLLKSKGDVEDAVCKLFSDDC